MKRKVIPVFLIMVFLSAIITDFTPVFASTYPTIPDAPSGYNYTLTYSYNDTDGYADIDTIYSTEPMTFDTSPFVNDTTYTYMSIGNTDKCVMYTHYSRFSYWQLMQTSNNSCTIGELGKNVQITYANYQVKTLAGDNAYSPMTHDYPTIWTNARKSLTDALLNPFEVVSSEQLFDNLGSAFTGSPFTMFKNVKNIAGQLEANSPTIENLSQFTNKDGLKYELVIGFEDTDQMNAFHWNGFNGMPNFATVSVVYSTEPIVIIKDSDGNASGYKTYLPNSEDKCNVTIVNYSANFTQLGALFPVHADLEYPNVTTNTYTHANDHFSDTFTRNPPTDRCTTVLLWSDTLLKADNGTSSGGDTIYTPPAGGGGSGGSSGVSSDSIWNGFNLLDPTTWFTPFMNIFSMIQNGVETPVNLIISVYSICMSWLPQEITDLLVFGFVSAVILLIFGRR